MRVRAEVEPARGLSFGMDSAVWCISAAVCLLAAIWLHRHRARYGPAQYALVRALGLTGIWALTGGLAGADAAPTALAEGARNLGWIWAFYRLFAVDGRHALVRPVRPLLAVLAFVEMLQIAAQLLVVLASKPGLLAPGFHTVSLLHLLVAIGGLVLLHNLYGGATSQARAIVRAPAAALALLWTADLNYYAAAYLADGAIPSMSMLRGVLCLPVTALLTFGGTDKVGIPRFRPSRAVAFRSISLLLIGIYLAVMVGVGQWLAAGGSDYAGDLQLAFVAAATIIALALVPSSRLRGWLRVTTAKHFFQHRYDYRAEWLRFTGTIGQSGADTATLEERVIRAVADITDSPAGMLLTPSDGGQLELAARWQWPTAEVPARALDAAAMRLLESGAYVADLDELRSGRGSEAARQLLPQWLLDEPRAWALVPLLHYERLVGAVVLARPQYARRLDWEDFDLLRVAGQQLASYLAEHAGQAALAEAARFDDFHRRIAFVMHDIKNLASQMSLLARNAESHAENPEFRADMLVTLRNSADKLNALLARLSRYGVPSVAAIEAVRADSVAQGVVAQLRIGHPVTLVEVEPVEVAAQRSSLEQVLLHLVQNAIDTSPADAPVFLRVGTEGIYGVIEVVDAGSGMSPEFVRSRLFKPFDSTKQGGFGIGAYEARELVRAMNGQLDVESREGLGTRFVIRLPLAEAAQLLRTLDASTAISTKVA